MILALTIVLVLAVFVADYRRQPHCRWCDMRHRGRCIWNPRSGRVFANVQDGRFNYDHPNE